MRTAVFVVVLGCSTAFTNCGGKGGSASSGSPPPAQNPAPTIAAISPNSNDQGGPDISLSIVGSNFIDASTVEWNGSQLSTTFVNSTLVTAVIPASSFAAAGSNAVKVFNPAPGGGSSSELTFTVPCPVPAPAAASAQTKARLGAYYFDGWSGPLTNFHFQGLPFGPYQDRQPLSAWQDNTACAVEQQLAVAHNYGVDFFVFDWYFNVQVTDPEENLNSGLQITHSLANRHGMQYAILYVDDPPFDVGPSDWNSAVNEWVGYMTDPDYLRINGLPALFIINVGEMRQIFGTAVAVSSALAQLRTAAQAQGLPGVYVVGGFGVPSNAMGQPSLTSGFDIAQSDGYDAVAFYGYSFAPTPALWAFALLHVVGRRPVDMGPGCAIQCAALYPHGHVGIGIPGRGTKLSQPPAISCGTRGLRRIYPHLYPARSPGPQPTRSTGRSLRPRRHSSSLRLGMSLGKGVTFFRRWLMAQPMAMRSPRCYKYPRTSSSLQACFTCRVCGSPAQSSSTCGRAGLMASGKVALR